MEFVGPTSKGLLCTICSRPWEPEAAMQCAACETVQCKSCQGVSGGSCNQCSNTLTNLPRLVRQLAESAKVCCPNKTNGCDWTGTRTEFKTHSCTKQNQTFLYVDEKDIPAELQCAICHCPFLDPVQLPCEHVFCTTCITDVLKQDSKCCPLDMKAAALSDLTPAPKMISEMVADLSVYCSLKTADPKCDWVGPRSQLKKHMADPKECKGKANKKNVTVTDPSAGTSSKMELTAMSEFKSFNATADPASTELYTLAHMVAPRLKDLSERKKPLSISAVIDVSGSMAGGKLKMAQDSLKFMIDELTDRDELGIIAFHTDVAETITLTKMDELGKMRCKAAAESLRALNRTNLSGGLFAGMDQVQHLPFNAPAATVSPRQTRNSRGSFMNNAVSKISSSFKSSPSPVTVPPAAGGAAHPDSCRAVLLFTDGIANGGLTNEAQFKAALQSKLKLPGTKDMVVHTFGFGSDHNAGLLQGVAEIASGSYYYIQDVASMKESFADCLGGLLSTVAQNIELTIKPEPGFEVCKVKTSFKQETQNGKTVVSMKDVYSTEKRDVLVSLKPSKSFPVSTTPIGLVHFSVKYDSLLSGATETVESTCKLIPGAAAPTDEANTTILEQRTRIMTTEALEEARARADAGDVAGAHKFMKSKRLELESCAPKGSAYVEAMLDDMGEVEDCMNDESAWCSSGSKAMAQVQMCHQQQRMNRCKESKADLGYDNEWKAKMRCASRKN